MSKSELNIHDRFDLKGVVIAPDLIKRSVDVVIETEEFYDYVSSKINVDRLGEVVFAVRENNKIWLTRQFEYPDGVYRIPSGGIGLEEPILNALKREVQEELGINIIDYKLIGFIEYKISYKEKLLDFYSFVFLIEKFSKDSEIETDGEISEILPVEINNMKKYIDVLLNQKGFWKDWGKLRYQSSHIIFEYLTL